MAGGEGVVGRGTAVEEGRGGGVDELARRRKKWGRKVSG